jgi:FkbM family methyltransferase
LNDIRTILSGSPRCVLDVGAHVGESATAFRRAFPAAAIHCFEPDPENFSALVQNTRRDSHIHCTQVAVGREAGSALFHRNAGSQTHSLLDVAAGAEAFVVAPAILTAANDITVNVVTLDEVCLASRERPDVVKVDSQGFELEVLSGATRLLGGSRPPLLYLEVSFVRGYEGQPLFDDVYRWVFARGYRIVGLYEAGFRTHYYQVGANALFVHESMGQRHPPRGR